MIKARAACVTVTACLFALSACQLQTLGAAKGPLRLVATFDDAQHLVAGHSVRVADVRVGSVTSVKLAGYRARVTMSIKAGHKVPAGTTAVVAQTSLLGENYVQLRYPDHFDPSRGPFLRSGDRIADTSVDPSIEHVAEKGIEVLAAVQSGDLAAIINTGATGLGGKGDELHRLISQLADVGDAIASQRNDLGAAVDGFGALGARLAAGAEDVGSLLDSLSRATATVTDQRSRIVDAVSGLTDLATALNERVLGPHQRQLEALVAQLRPVTATLAEDRDTLGQLLSGLAVLATRAPHAFDAYGDLILYGWFDGLRQPNGTVTPFPSSGAAAVRSLMEPPR